MVGVDLWKCHSRVCFRIHSLVFNMNIKSPLEKVGHWDTVSHFCSEIKLWVVQTLCLCVPVLGTPNRKGAVHHCFRSGPWRCDIHLKMSQIVLVNFRLLGLVKHNPDPQWNLERKQHKWLWILFHWKLQWSVTERRRTSQSGDFRRLAVITAVAVQKHQHRLDWAHYTEFACVFLS